MKKLCLTFEDFFNLNGAVLYNAQKIKPITKVTIDSRNVPSGSLFIAIKGDKFDGHDFVKDAVRKGACAVVVSKKKVSSIPECDTAIIAVDDTVFTFGELASVWRSKLNTKIIAVTGSAGKTTTKEIIFTLLNRKFRVNKTQANNNNHIGVPLTLFNTTNKYDYLVLELGTNHFGEIKYTAEIARPDYAMISNIGNSHLEFLRNKKGVYKEKSALFDVTVSNDGVLFINNDDNFLSNAYKKYSKRITYGFDKVAEVFGELKGYTDDGKPIVQINYKRKSSRFELPLYGEQNAKNFLAASAVALKSGLSFNEIKQNLYRIKSVDKRLNVQRIDNSYLINDTYNANPESMKMSLQLLSHFKSCNARIAVLGDMFELGNQSRKLHEGLAPQIIQSRLSALYTIGGKMKYLHKKIKEKKIEAIYFSERNELKNFLADKSFSSSAVLVKGSRGMRMEEFFETIKSNLKNRS